MRRDKLSRQIKNNQILPEGSIKEDPPFRCESRPATSSVNGINGVSRVENNAIDNQPKQHSGGLRK